MTESVNVTLGPGVTLICSITNTAIEPELTLVKVIEDDTNDDTTADAFGPTLSGPDGTVTVNWAASATGDSQTVAVPKVGTYNIGETLTSTLGYETDGWSCDDGTSSTDENHSIVLDVGDEVSCTITNTAVTPELTLVKNIVDTTGDTTQTDAFGPTVSGPNSFSSTTAWAADDTTASLDIPVTEVGSYNISENNAAALGYTTSGWSCDDTAGTSSGDENLTLVLDTGDDVTCTITNTAIAPQLTIVKNIVDPTGDTTQTDAFGPTLTGPSGAIAVAWPADNSSASISPTLTETGQYTLTENDVATLGYSTDGWTCTYVGAAPVTSTNETVTFDLVAGDDVTCTITNTADFPELTLVKNISDSTNDDTQTDAFGPTVTGPNGDEPVAWVADDNSNSQTITLSGVGTFDISEVDPTTLGYTTTGWSCNDDANTSSTDQNVTIDLGAGDEVTCTITNTAVAPELTLIKNIVDPTGDTTQTDDFGPIVSGPAGAVSVAWAASDTSNTQTVTLPEVGVYDIAEVDPATLGYTTGGWICTDADGATVGFSTDHDTSITVDTGDEITCEITNTAIVPEITIIKNIMDTTGDPTQTDAFGPTLTGPSGAIAGVAWAADDTTSSISPTLTESGSYTLTENNAADLGYTTSGWECTYANGGGVQASSNETISFDLFAGDNITCEITNTVIEPELTLVKNIVDSTADDTQTDDFGPTVNGPTSPVSVAWAASDSSDSQTVTLTETGTFNISEVDPDTLGYTTIGWTCVDADGATVASSTDHNVSVDIFAGDDITCTIENTAVQPQLTVIKNITNTIQDDLTTDAFGPTLTGPNGTETLAWAASATSDSQSITLTSVGNYNLSEVDPDTLGYSTTGWSCVDGDGAAFASSTDHNVALTLDTGDDITCTITNETVAPELTLIKNITDTTDDTTQTDDFGPTVTGPSGAVTVAWAANDTSDSQTITLPEVGVYDIAEVDPATLGYSTGGWTCTDADGATVGFSTDHDTSFTADAGDEITCTITNTVVEPQLTLVKVIDDETGDDTTADEFGPTITDPTGDDVAIAWQALDAGDTQTVTLTEMGTYDISENSAIALGYTTSGWSCDDGTSSTDENHSVDIGPGDDITCTITNTAIKPGLTITKTIVDSTDDPTQTDDFGPTITGTGGPITTDVNGLTIGWGAEDVTDSQTIELATGDYTITEATIDGYETDGWTCTDATGAEVVTSTTASVGVTMGPGITLICSITNTAVAPELTLVKNITDTTNDDTTTDAFGPTVTGPDGEVIVNWAASATSDSQTVTVPKIGDYDISEVVADTLGYTTTGWTCDDDANTTSTDENVTVNLGVGDDVTCTITNTAEAPQLTLIKTIDDPTGDPTTTDAFGPTLTGPSGAIAAPWAANTVTASVSPTLTEVGTYDISENNAAALGYTTTGWACTDENGAAFASSTDENISIVLDTGDDITCRITNTAVQPQLTLVKNIVDNISDSAQTDDFGPSVTGPNGAETIAWGASDSTDSQTISITTTGSYTIAEVDPATLGYTTTGWSCEGALDGVVDSSTNHEITIDIVPGDDITCTITNTAVEPTLTLIKVIEDDTNDDTQTDAFGPTVVGPNGNVTVAWLADDDTDTQVLTLDAVGSYDISEVNAASLGYTTSGWSCDSTVNGASASSTEDININISAGDDVTCTITNTAIAPELTLVKNIVDTTDDTTQTDDFGPSLTGPSGTIAVAWAADDTSSSISPTLTEVGSYSISENDADTLGYTTSGWSCEDADGVSFGTSTDEAIDIVLDTGDDVTCTITNTVVQPQLTVIKNITNTIGDPSTTDAFGPTLLDPDSLDVSLNWEASATSDSETVSLTKIGSYTLTETDADSLGYSTSGWSCTSDVNGVSGSSDESISLNIGPGENITCEITNTAIEPQLTLVKNIVDTTDDDTQTDDFGPTVTGPDGAVTAGWVANDTQATEVLTLDSIGTYSVSETDAASLGYDTSGWQCVDDETAQVVSSSTDEAVDVTLAAGQEVTCTITNTAVEPQLTLVKNIVDTTSDDTQTDDFGPSVTGPNGAETIAWAANDTTNSQTITVASVGTYSISENTAADLGYTTSGWSCEDADGVSFGTSTNEAIDIVLDTGDDVTCTITNTAVQPVLRLVKNIVDTTDDTTQTDAFGPTVMGPDGEVITNWVANDTTDTQVLTVDSVGDYTITEVNAASLGYTTSGWSCTDADSTTSLDESVTITLDTGDDVTCTITNTVVEPQLTLVKVIDDETGDDTTADEFGPTITDPTGDDIAIAWQALDAGDSQTVTLTEMGTYSISENNAFALGYTTTGWSCDDGSSSTDENHSVDIGPGDDITCTITNTAIKPGLTLIKTIVDSADDPTQTDNFGPAVFGSGGQITTDVNGLTIGWGADDVTSSQTIELATGDYTIVESDIIGYETDGWSCTDAGGAPVTSSTDGTVNVTMGPGITLICSITNTAIAPELTLTKTIDDSTDDDTTTDAFGPTVVGPDGEVTVNWAASATSDTQTVTVPKIGDYNISEVLADSLGYETDGWSCTDTAGDNSSQVITSNDENITVNLALGDEVNCEITNTAVEPQLTLTKNIVDTTGDSTQTDDFGPSVTGPNGAETIAWGEADTSDTQTITLASVGDYNISEVNAASLGYTTSGWTCVDEDGAEFGTSATEDITLTLDTGDDITCEITNTVVQPQLTVIKNIVDSTSDNTTTDFFGPTLLDPNGNDVTLDWAVSDSSDSQTVTLVEVGNYSLSEVNAESLGYSTSGWSCSSNVNGVSGSSNESISLNIGPGEIVTCEITNTAVEPILRLVKNISDSTDDDTQTNAFGPTVTGPDGELTVNWEAEDTTDTEVLTIATVGDYTITEVDAESLGYSTSGWSCVDTDGASFGTSTNETVSITLDTGDDVTCTIENTAVEPQLTLVKNIVDTTSDDTQTDDFGPSVTGPNGAETIAWAPNDTTNSQTITVASVGTYSISENTAADLGYTTSGWSCEDADGVSFGTSTNEAIDIVLDTGDHVTCTITNTATAPQLTLVKNITDTTNDDTQTDAFGPTLTGPDGPVTITWAASDTSDSQTVTVDSVGDYTMSEIVAATLGYSTSGWSCDDGTSSTNEDHTITLDTGDDVTCTITNTAVEPQLTLTKVIVDDTGDTTQTDAFGPTLTDPNGDEITIQWAADDNTDSQTVTLSEVGSYTMSEVNALSLGYTTSGWSCDDGTGSTNTQSETHTIDIGPGDVVECTITNTAIQPGLTLIKTIVDSTDDPTQTNAFGPTVTVSGAGGPLTVDVNGDPIGWTADDTTSSITVALDAGDYTVTEATIDGYTTSGWTCTDLQGGTVASSATTAVDVSLAAGETLICNITNTAVEPQLTVVKTIEDDTNDDTQTNAFGPTLLDPTGDPVAIAWAADDTSNSQMVSLTEVGVYDLSEVDPDTLGYTTSGWICTDANGATVASSSDHTVSVDLQVGDDITCSITNTATAPELTLIKNIVDTTEDDTTTDAFGPTVTGPNGAITVNWTANDTLASLSVPIDEVGTYDISETNAASLGYSTSGWTCTDADGASFASSANEAVSLVLDTGDEITCEITNTAIEPQLTVIKTIVDSTDDATTTDDFGPILLDPDGNDVALNWAVSDSTDTQTISLTEVGTYNLSEIDPATFGYETSGWTCVDANNVPVAMSGAGVAGLDLTVDTGDEITCSITNTAVEPQLTLIKNINDTINDPTQTDAFGPTLIGPDGAVTVNWDAEDVTDTQVLTIATAGEYDLSETNAQSLGYIASGWTCTNDRPGVPSNHASSATEDVTFTLLPMDDVTCEITNSVTAPELTLVKIIEDDYNDPTQTDDFGPTITDPNGNDVPVAWAASDTTDSQTVTLTGVGQFTISEVTASTFGYTTSGWSCDNGSSSTTESHTLDVGPGNDITCTITNTAIAPRIRLIKVIDTNGVTLPNPPTRDDFGLLLDGNPVNSHAWNDVQAGDHVASEVGLPGWVGSNWRTDCDTDGSISISAGESLTCRITNTLQTTEVTVEKDWRGPSWPDGMRVRVRVTDANNPSFVYGVADITSDNGTVTIGDIPDQTSIMITERVIDGPDCQRGLTTEFGPLQVDLQGQAVSVNDLLNGGANYVLVNAPCRYSVEVDKTWDTWGRWPDGTTVDITIESDSRSISGTVSNFGQTVRLDNIPTTESYTITETVNGLSCSVPVSPANGRFNEGPINLAAGEHLKVFTHTIDNRPCEGSITIRKDWTGDKWPEGMTITIDMVDADDGTQYGSGVITSDGGTVVVDPVPAGRTVIITEEIGGTRECMVANVERFRVEIDVPPGSDGASFNDLLNNGRPYTFRNSPCTIDVLVEKDWTGETWPNGMIVDLRVVDVDSGEVYGSAAITEDGGTALIEGIPDGANVRLIEVVRGEPTCSVQTVKEFGPIEISLAADEDGTLMNDLYNNGENYVFVNEPCRFTVEIDKVWENTAWPQDVTVDIDLDSTTEDGSGVLASHDDVVRVEGLEDGSSYTITESVNGRECYVNVDPLSDTFDQGPVQLGPGEDGKVIRHTYVNRVCYYVVEVTKDWFFGTWPLTRQGNPWEVEVRVENTNNGITRDDVLSGLNDRVRIRVPDHNGHIVTERVFGDECFTTLAPDEGFFLEETVELQAGEDGKVIPYHFENKVCTYLVEVVKEWDDGKWPAGSSVELTVQSRSPEGHQYPTRRGSRVVTDSTQVLTVEIPTGQGYLITESVRGVGCFEHVRPSSGVIGRNPVYVKQGQNVVFKHRFINHECHHRVNPNRVLPAVGRGESDPRIEVCPDLMLSTLVTQDGQAYITTNGDTLYGNGHAVVQRGINPSLEQQKRIYVAEYADGSGIYSAPPVPNARRTRLVDNAFDPVLGANRQVAYHDDQGQLFIYDIVNDEILVVEHENGETVMSTEYDWSFDDRILTFVDEQGLWAWDGESAPTLLRAGNISQPDAGTTLVAYMVNGNDIEVMKWETGEIVFTTEGVEGDFVQPAMSGDEQWLAFVYRIDDTSSLLMKDLNNENNNQGINRMTDVVENGDGVSGTQIAEPAWYCTNESIYFTGDYALNGETGFGIWSLLPTDVLDTIEFVDGQVQSQFVSSDMFLVQQTVGWRPNSVNNAVPVGSRGNEGFDVREYIQIGEVIENYDFRSLRIQTQNVIADAAWYFLRVESNS